MRHTCSDGTTARLVRDPKAPIGELARHTCPKCGWTKDGATILADATATVSAARASLR